ncbi:MAG TPA: hypothetical protein VH575_20800 [Gemmataceae bacterium]|jgi:hypothetical protein
MKNFLAATIGALVFFWLVVLAGAIWGGVNRLAEGSECFSSAERLAVGAFFGGADFAFYGGLPAAVIGAVAGPLAVSIFSRRRIVRHPLEQHRSLLDLFADSLLFLVVVIEAATIACVTGFIAFHMFYHTGE